MTEMEPVPMAQMLGLTCPDHPGVRLDDRIGPFWCREGHFVSAFVFLKTALEMHKAAMLALAREQVEREEAGTEYCTCTPEQAAIGPCGKPSRQL